MKLLRYGTGLQRQVKRMLIENSMYDSEYCYECSGYGDNYYIDEDGELVCNCDTCSMAQFIEVD